MLEKLDFIFVEGKENKYIYTKKKQSKKPFRRNFLLAGLVFDLPYGNM